MYNALMYMFLKDERKSALSFVVYRSFINLDWQYTCKFGDPNEIRCWKYLDSKKERKKLVKYGVGFQHFAKIQMYWSDGAL